MERSTYEIAQIIQRFIVRRAAEAMLYGTWSPGFIAGYLKEVPDKIKCAEWYKPIELSNFSEDQMKDLGFVRWSEDDPMYMIPLWLYPFLPDEIECKSIDGVQVRYKKSEMNTDSRFGCLAYGVYV
jgi:hypothetical protein